MAPGSIVEGLKRIGAADAVIGLAKEDQEANEEAIAIRNLVSAVSVPFFQESVVTQELTNIRVAVTNYLSAELLDSVIEAKVLEKVKPEERLDYYSNAQYAKVLTGAKQSEYKRLDINQDMLIDSRTAAREALEPYLEELLADKLRKSTTFQKLSDKQIDRVRELGIPVILSALIDQARQQFVELTAPELIKGMSYEELERIVNGEVLKQVVFRYSEHPVVKFLSDLLTNLEEKATQNEKVFVDGEPALLEVQKEISESIFDKPFSWSLREISDQAVERYFELRLAGPKDFFFPRDAEGNRHFDLKRGIPTALGALLIIGIIAAACNNLGPDNTPNPPLTPADDDHETPNIIPSGSIPEVTLTPVPQILDGSLVLDVGSFPGAPPGVGGPDGGIATPFTELMRSLINSQGFGVVYAPNELGGPGQNLISVENDQICFAPIPDHLFAPYLGPEEQIFPLFEKQTAWGVVPFGTRDGTIHEQVITSFKIPNQFSAGKYNCLMGYALENNQYHIAAGSLTALIIDENNSVVAWSDIGYDADAKISHQADVTPVVDGKALTWEILPSAVATPSETPTVHPEGQLFPTTWNDRFIIEMPNGLDYDQMSQILQTNNSLALNDDTHAAVSCSSMPAAEANQELSLPRRLLSSFDKNGIVALYEIKSDNDASDYIMSLKCTNGQVNNSIINLFFGHDIPKDTQNFINELLTNDYYGGWAVIWGTTPFSIPERPFSENLVQDVISKGVVRDFAFFQDGYIGQPGSQEYVDIINNLASNVVVIYDFDFKP